MNKLMKFEVHSIGAMGGGINHGTFLKSLIFMVLFVETTTMVHHFYFG
jgi:hypothetical protein